MEYVKPKVSDYGSLRDLTEAQVIGTQTDAAFPAGTLVASLTFSTPAGP